LSNRRHLAKLKEGVEPWNLWRKQDPKIRPDLSKAQLSEAHLVAADLHSVNLHGANLLDANLSVADLRHAYLHRATLRGARLTGVNLQKADFRGADLLDAKLRNANLSGAVLNRATLVNTNLEGANLTDCSVYGCSAWKVKLQGAIQRNLVITPEGESPIQVDNLEVAQFIYLLLNNEKIKSAIDTITYKVVLILGRFTPERKVVLDAIRDELRKRDYLPVLFDFEPPVSKNLTGTILTLANMARFIIADLTDPSRVPYELGRIVPGTKVPVQAIILDGQKEFPMYPGLMEDYHWVLRPHQYKSQDLLIANLGETVIAPAEAKAKELAGKK
jgi:pentapeptide repeat protein